MTNIIAEFNYVNLSQNCRTGDDGPIETRFETPSELYRFCLREYGRCKASVYITEGTNKADSKDKRIGWIFIKRVKYTDCNEYFLQETWVSIHDKLPERHTTYHYAELGAR